MRAVVQRVSRAEVNVAGKTIAATGGGLLVLLGVYAGDGMEQAAALARKTAKLRIFADQKGKMNLSLAEIGGEVLAVSQFTLCADCSSGNRPSFAAAARPETALSLYEEFCGVLSMLGVKVSRGVFGAHMDVSLVNDGPVTIILDNSKADAPSLSRDK